MAGCQNCGKKFPMLTVRDVRRPNPLGEGELCEDCYTPYGLTLEKYLANKIPAETNPKAAAWVALCYILAARRVNLKRTLVAILCDICETKNSWEVCRQRAMEFTKKAMSALPPKSQSHMFMKGLYDMAERISQPPPREIPLQVHASPLAGTVRDIGYEAVRQSGATIDELNHLVASVPGHQWLTTL